MTGLAVGDKVSVTIPVWRDGDRDFSELVGWVDRLDDETVVVSDTPPGETNDDVWTATFNRRRTDIWRLTDG